MLKNKNGITLIALVVTIIVLLILAGVSIVTLTGDNGIITRTQQSKQLSEEAAAREKVKLAVQAARIHDKSYSYLKASEVRTAVNNEEGLSTDKEGDFPVIVTAGKFTFSVSSTGEVGYIEGISIPSELTVGVGLQGQTITPALGQGITGTIIWKSSDENKVKVNNGALTVDAVTGENPVKITASIKDLATGIEYKGECLVTAKNAYTVSYYGEDKTTLLQDPITVVEGTSATYSGATPTKEATTDYTYTFDNKWLNVLDGTDATGSLASVTSNLSVYPSFTAKSKAVAFRSYGNAVATNETAGTYGTLGTPVELNSGSAITVGSNTIPDDWKVFYEDSNFVYLIYGHYYPVNVQSSTVSNVTIGGGSDATYAVYGSNRADLLCYLRNNTAYSWNISTNPGTESHGTNGNTYPNWDSLKNAIVTATEKSADAITIQGCPDIELWDKSWVAKGNSTIINESSKANRTGYYIYGADNKNMKNDKPWSTGSVPATQTTPGTGYYDELYFPYREHSSGDNYTAYGYWLASPGAYYTNDSLCRVYYSGGVGLLNFYYDAYFCVRPVVSIAK